MSAVPAEAHDGWTEEWNGQPPTHYEFPDKASKPQSWDGWLIGEDSTEVDRPRWTDIEVYRTVTGKYVLRVLGRSVIYHLHNAICNTGDPQLGQNMDNDMQPCRRCNPPADYTSRIHDNTLFNVEVDIPTITSCPNPRQLIRALHNRGGKGGADELSYLAGRLLRQLREADPAIDAELSKPVILN